MCTHLVDALATSVGSKNRLYIRGVGQTHGDMYTRQHRWRSQRGHVEDARRRTSAGPPRAQKHIKIEFTRCPGRSEAHPPLFLFSGQRRRDPLTTSGRRRSQMRLRPAIWEGKGFGSSPELALFHHEHFSYKEKNKKKMNRNNRETDDDSHNSNLSNYRRNYLLF